jgi:IQ calmodulin-binding motif
MQKMWRMKLARVRMSRLPSSVVKLQAVVRSKLARLNFRVMIWSIILIQSGFRRKLDTRVYHRLKSKKVCNNTMILGHHCRSSAVTIERWWRRILDFRKKKRAVQVIERFFIRILEEINEEVILLTNNIAISDPMKKTVNFSEDVIQWDRNLSTSNSTDTSIQSPLSPQRRLRILGVVLTLFRFVKHACCWRWKRDKSSFE